MENFKIIENFDERAKAELMQFLETKVGDLPNQLTGTNILPFSYYHIIIIISNIPTVFTSHDIQN